MQGKSQLQKTPAILPCLKCRRQFQHRETPATLKCPYLQERCSSWSSDPRANIIQIGWSTWVWRRPRGKRKRCWNKCSKFGAGRRTRTFQRDHQLIWPCQSVSASGTNRHGSFNLYSIYITAYHYLSGKVNFFAISFGPRKCWKGGSTKCGQCLVSYEAREGLLSMCMIAQFKNICCLQGSAYLTA